MITEWEKRIFHVARVMEPQKKIGEGGGGGNHKLVRDTLASIWR